MTKPSDKAVFDACADDYDAELARGLSVSGEDKDYFARGRIAWLKRSLQQIGFAVKSAMDYGCGIGSSSAYFFELLGVESLVGTDTSTKALEIARSEYPSRQANFVLVDHYEPSESLDLVFSNGVFHHIPLDRRATALQYIHQALRPGGLFSFWENNPWNPGTRYVMSRIPFDRDAITLTPPEARTLLRAAGFEILSTNFLFIFPRILRCLRPLELLCARLPLGGQYQVLCRKAVAVSR